MNFKVLYIPCIFAIWQHIQNPCYKFMFVMGLLDIPALAIIAILTGWLDVFGAVYCSSPKLIYIAGASACGSVCGLKSYFFIKFHIERVCFTNWSLSSMGFGVNCGDLFGIEQVH